MCYIEVMKVYDGILAFNSRFLMFEARSVIFPMPSKRLLKYFISMLNRADGSCNILKLLSCLFLFYISIEELLSVILFTGAVDAPSTLWSCISSSPKVTGWRGLLLAFT